MHDLLIIIAIATILYGNAQLGCLFNFINIVLISILLVFLFENKIIFFFMLGLTVIIFINLGLNKLLDYLLYQKMTPEERELEEKKRYWRKNNRF